MPCRCNTRFGRRKRVRPRRCNAILPLYLGVLLRASADVLLYAYLPIHLHAHLGESRFWLISLIPTAPAFIRFLMAPFWGRCVDRWGRQRPFVVMGLAAYGLLLVTLPHLDRSTLIVVAVAAFAVPFSAFNPVSRTWLTLSEREEGVFRLARWYQWEAAGYMGSSALIGWFAGSNPVAFVQVMRWGAVLLIACALAVTRLLRDRPARAGRLQRSQAADSGTRMQMQTKVAHLFPASVLLFLVASSLAWESVATSFGLYFTESLSGSVRLYGLTLGGSTFLSLLAYGALAEFGRRTGEQPLFRAAAWGYTLMFVLIAHPSPWTAALGYLLPLATVVRTAMNFHIVGRVSELQRGRAMGVMEAAEACSGTFGALLGGMLADRFGLSLIPRVALCSTVLLHLLTWRRRR